MDSGWENVPEPVLLNVLSHLEVADVLRCSRVCRRWCGISQGNSMWKELFVRDFLWRPKTSRQNYLRCRGVEGVKKLATLRDPATDTWKNEYVRLSHHVPKVEEQVLKNTARVSSLTFSNDGMDLAANTWDNILKIYRRIGTRFEYFQNLPFRDWNSIGVVSYSPESSKLLVKGSTGSYESEAMIYRRGARSYTLLTRLCYDRNDVWACWISERFFLTGSLDDLLGASIVSLTGISCAEGPAMEEEENEEGEPEYDGDPAYSDQDNNDEPHSHVKTYQVELFRFRDSLGYAGEMQGKLLHVTGPPAAPPTQKKIQFLKQKLNESNESRDPLQDEHLLGLAEDLAAWGEMKLIFAHASDCEVPHEVAFQRLNLNAFMLMGSEDEALPENLVDLKGHIIGFDVSPCKNHLLVNVRPWPENAVPSLVQSPCISTSVEVRIVDLNSYDLLQKVFVGHVGYTASEQTIDLYLDAHGDYVGSGSEDGKACVWDRHYGVLVSQLDSVETAQSCVISPADQEVAATSSNDCNVRIWWSRSKKLEFAKIRS